MKPIEERLKNCTTEQQVMIVWLQELTEAVQAQSKALVELVQALKEKEGNKWFGKSKR